MSCTICHTPILVHHNFLDPSHLESTTQIDHLEPIVAKVCPAKLHQPYFRKAVQIDRRYEGVVMENLAHMGWGNFISTHWKISGGGAIRMTQEDVSEGVTKNSLCVAHEGCFKLLCSYLGVPFDFTNREMLIALLERHEFLGTTVFGGYDGIDYSEGDLEKRWLSQPFGSEDANVFAWDFAHSEQDWTMKRPDMFPRLHITVKLERLEMCNNQTPSDDPLSNTPDLVFLNIAKRLALADLYNISVLNKTIRHRTLTNMTFQSIVRYKLLETKWALPIPTEYPTPIPEGYAHPCATGDWLLYGYHIFKTQSMRNRRRIFNIIAQLDRQYHKKATEAGYLSSPKSESMKSYFAILIDQQLLLHKLNLLFDYNLFIKVVVLLNEAVQRDLKEPKFQGIHLPGAYETAKRMIEGKSPIPEVRPTGTLEDRMHEVIAQRTVLVFEDKRIYSQPRRGRPSRVPGATG